ncbi:MAG: Fe-S cluster assembly protein NifU [Lentisphaerae bacterium GWF2_45_14]|nr:MAG: Fe-S cluster assembly protein NifU [Lentisphaerae bacterium GWF2_45_14]
MWDYNQKVMDHFLHPRNVGEMPEPDAVGEVGNMTCGDALKLFLKVSPDGRIEDVKFQTFGCASAIASSSVLTEIVKGMTLSEAEKVTNKDIVEVLGELPEEKMHCSVMGMEALQAAIANYKGVSTPLSSETSEHEGRIVCKCFGVTDVKIRRVVKENNLHTAEQVTNYCKAGGACGSCLDSIQEIIDGIWRGAASEKTESSADSFGKLSPVRKVLRIQEIIEKEIKPLLEKDGGSIELIDINENEVMVKLAGRCASCPASQVTLKHTVEGKLREFASRSLSVKNVD